VRASDSSPAVGDQSPVGGPPAAAERRATSVHPLGSGDGAGTAPAPVTVPAPASDSRPTAVVVPPLAFRADSRDSRQSSPFSFRKVVLTAPIESVVGEGDVPAAQRVTASSRVAPAGPVAETADVDAGAESTHPNGSSGDRHSAIINGLRWTMIGRPAVEAGNLLAVAILARLVAPAEFGRYAIALIVLSLASVPTQAVQYSLVQRDHIDRAHLRTGVTLTLLMGFAVCAFCLAASFTFVPSLFGERTAVLVRLMIPACFVNSVNTVQIAIITRRLEFRRLSLLDMTIMVVGTAGAIAMAAEGLNGTALALGVLASSIAGFILLCYWVLPPIPAFRLSAARDLLGSGIHAASGAASLVGFQNCDYVIVGARLGALQAGYYFRAYTLSVVYQKKVTQVLTSVGFPVLSRAAGEDEVARLRQRMVHTITLILFPLLAGLVIVAPKFVTWFYGSTWDAAVVPVQILAIGGGAMLVVETVTVAMLATGRARAVMWWGWGHFIAYGAAVFAVSGLGLAAIALAAAVVHTIFLLVSYIQLHHGSFRRGLRTLADDVLPATASSLVLAAAALPASVLATSLGVPTLPYLLLIAVAGGAAYLASLRLWFPTELRHLGLLAGRLLPGRAHRLVSRFIMRAQPQSAA
jgi:lipopolysaccharide exporter